MAGKNQVTLTFAGDSEKLERTLDKVGASAKKASEDVGKSSQEVKDGFDRAGEAADGTYDKFDALEAVGRGTSDTMTGLGEIMSGNVLQGATDLAGGVAALADGFAGALLPALRAGAGGFKSAALAAKAFTLSLLTNPVFLIGAAIAALVVGIVILYKKSETARAIINGAFRGIATVIATVVTGALRYFQFLANAALTVAEKVIGAFAAIPGPQQKALKAAAAQVRSWKGDVNASFDAAIGKVQALNNKIQGIPSAKKITVTVEEIHSRKNVGEFGGGVNSRGPARAGGGPVWPGAAFPVGENGPEIFVPSQGGTILPNGGGGRNAVAVELGPRTIDALARAQSRALAGARLRLETRGGQTYATLLPSGG